MCHLCMRHSWCCQLPTAGCLAASTAGVAGQCAHPSAVPACASCLGQHSQPASKAVSQVTVYGSTANTNNRYRTRPKRERHEWGQTTKHGKQGAIQAGQSSRTHPPTEQTKAGQQQMQQFHHAGRCRTCQIRQQDLWPRPSISHPPTQPANSVPHADQLPAAVMAAPSQAPPPHQSLPAIASCSSTSRFSGSHCSWCGRQQAAGTIVAPRW
jgi:hypothetical protein